MQRPPRTRTYIHPPTAEEVRTAAGANFMTLGDAESAQLAEVIAEVCEMIDTLDELDAPAPLPSHHYRDPGSRPAPEADPYNAFIRRCEVRGADEGPLAGKTVGVKDNLAIAGVPLTNGSRMPAFVPELDSVVVERLLEAGATIVGTLNMDDFAASGSGLTSAFGPPLNPVDTARSCGGSSGGSGAAVASGAVDLAIGIDEGGSARIPASYCGTVAVKATHGLVPTFGMTYIDHSLDYVCPMAIRVGDVATALEVIAGPDWRDPQFVRGTIRTDRYTEAEERGVEGLRVGIVAEGASPEQCERAVLDGLERAGEALEAAGAVCERVTIPLWPHAWPISLCFQIHAATAMIESEGQGHGHLGYVDVARQHAFGVARRSDADQFPPSARIWLVTGRYLHDRYYNTYFGKAQNLRLTLRRQVEQTLRSYDLLLTPTTPTTAPKLTLGRTSETDLIAAGTTRIDMALNTSPLNLSGHPGLALPSGRDASGLPTSVQLGGRHFDELTVFRAAYVLERAFASTSAAG